jgi:glucose-1-phosphate thymidylyltransferase
VIKGVILAGGTGSRLFPLTKVTNKHLLPIGREPMIFHPIKKLLNAGVRDILIVTGTEHMGAVVQLLGSGEDFGGRFTYKVQDQAGGIAQALGLAEDFVGHNRMVVILGDNIFQGSIASHVDAFSKQESGARILIKEVPDPTRYGVAELDGDKIISIEEKPAAPKSSYCVTGVYFYDNRVFSLVRNLEPSRRGELEITDVNNAYIESSELTYGILDGWWTDAGTFDSYAHANQLLNDRDHEPEAPSSSTAAGEI